MEYHAYANHAYGIYEIIALNTSSELILFFLIMAVVVIPLYWLISKGRKAGRQLEREREQQIIEVIKENSTVIAGLKSTLDDSRAATGEALERIHARIDNQSRTLKAIFADIMQMKIRAAAVSEKSKRKKQTK